MATNLLTPDQASFEGGVAGWAAIAHPGALVNMIGSDDRASIEAGSTAPGSFVAGWGTWSGGQQVARDPAKARVGVSSLRMTRGDGSAGAAQATPSPSSGVLRYPVVGGHVYAFIASLQVSASADLTTAHQIGVGIRNTALVNLDTQITYPAIAGAWDDLAYTFAVPSDAQDVYFLITEMIAAAATAHLDRVAFYDLGAYVYPGRGMLTELQASIETGPTTPAASMPGWSAGTSTLVSRTTDQAKAGASSLRVQWNGAAPGTGVTGLADTAGNAVGVPISDVTKRYRLVASVYTPVGGAIRMRCLSLNAGGAVVGSQAADSTIITVPPNKWTPIQVDVVPNAAAVRLRPYFSMGAMAPGAVFYVDEVGFDLAPNPPSFVLPSDIGVSIARADDAAAPHGTHVMAVSRTPVDGGMVEAATTPIAATPGKTYSALGTFAATIPVAVGLALDFLDSGGAVLASPNGIASASQVWDDTRAVGVAPAGTTQVRIRCAATIGAGAVVRADKMALYDADVSMWVPGGEAVPTYFNIATDPYSHRVNVAVLNIAAGTLTVSIERVMPGGRIEKVRNAQNLAAVAGSVIFDDFDAPTDTPFQYRIVGTQIISQSVTLESLGYFFLADPNLPGEAIRVIPAANAIPQWKRDAPVGVHRVLGRPDPVVVTDTRWWASGELTLYTLTNNQREEVGQMTSLGITLALYGPSEVLGGVGRVYFVAPTVDERRVSARGTQTEREWHLEITQVAQPSTVPVTPAFVTWQDVVDSYATWQDVVNGEVDWLDVMRDVPTTQRAPDVGWEW